MGDIEPRTGRFEIRVPASIADNDRLQVENELAELGPLSRVLGRLRWHDEANADWQEVWVYSVDVVDGFAAGPKLKNVCRMVQTFTGQETAYLVWHAISGTVVG